MLLQNLYFHIISKLFGLYRISLLLISCYSMIFLLSFSFTVVKEGPQISAAEYRRLEIELAKCKRQAEVSMAPHTDVTSFIFDLKFCLSF